MNRLPLDALLAFEIAARHLSFRAAAEDLHVTPAAVSQRIRHLEAMLGCRLFLRRARQVVLSEEGQVLAARLRAPLAEIEGALEAVRQTKDKGAIVISTTASFAQQCLFPLLARYGLANPAVEVKVLVDNHLVEFSRDRVDIAIRQGMGRYPGTHTALLMAGRYLPVCAPGVKAGAWGAPLIHVLWPDGFADAPVWANWFAARGEKAGARAAVTVTMESLAIQAALTGQGLALINQGYISRELARGDLVEPFGLGGEYETSVAHFLVRGAGIVRPEAQALWDWLLANAPT